MNCKGHDGVTTDGVSTGNRIYWALQHTTLTTFYRSVTQRLVFSVTGFTALLGNVFQQ
jgi:hypothetical protein